MMFKWIGTCFLGISIALVPTVRSEETTISLKDAIQTAYTHNLQIQATRIQLEAARRETGIARSNFLPRLDIEQRYVNTDQQVNAFGLKLNQGIITQDDFNPDRLNDPASITNFSTSVTLQQPLFNGGRELLGYKLAKSGVQSAQAELEKTVEWVLFETVKAYTGAMLAREGLSVARDALDTSRKNLEMVRHRFEEGLVIKSDLLQAEVHVSELTEREVRATHNLSLAVANLNLLLGVPESDFLPSDNLEGGSCPDIPLETLINWAVEDRPEMDDLQAKGQAAELQIKLARAPFLPNLNAQGMYEYHGDNILSGGADSLSLALSLRLNLFNGNADYHRLKQARSQSESLQKMTAARRDYIALEVEQAYLDLKSAEQRSIVTASAISQAEAGLEILVQRYREGAAGIVDLLRTELALANARFNRLQAHHDLLLGHAALCRSVGHLTTRWLDPDNCPVPPETNEIDSDAGI
jgi:outer membrane protein